MAFLLKRRDIAKIRYCPVQNGTYGQPTLNTKALQSLHRSQTACPASSATPL